MNLKRILRHLTMTQAQVNRAFPHSALKAIEQAIKASEMTHTGEVRVVDGEPLPAPKPGAVGPGRDFGIQNIG